MLQELKLERAARPSCVGSIGGCDVSGVAPPVPGGPPDRARVARARCGLQAGRLAGKSSRPLSCPYQMRPEVEARLVAMRREHPGWGPGTVLYWLELEGLQQLPGRTSVERCSARHETGA